MADSDQIQTILTRLEQGKQTHPNLCTLWACYLKLKKEAYQKAIVDAERAITTLQESPDPPDDLLVVIFALSRIIRDRDNNT